MSEQVAFRGASDSFVGLQDLAPLANGGAAIVFEYHVPEGTVGTGATYDDGTLSALYLDDNGETDSPRQVISTDDYSTYYGSDFARDDIVATGLADGGLAVAWTFWDNTAEYAGLRYRVLGGPDDPAMTPIHEPSDYIHYGFAIPGRTSLTALPTGSFALTSFAITDFDPDSGTYGLVVYSHLSQVIYPSGIASGREIASTREMHPDTYFSNGTLLPHETGGVVSISSRGPDVRNNAPEESALVIRRFSLDGAPLSDPVALEGYNGNRQEAALNGYGIALLAENAQGTVLLRLGFDGALLAERQLDEMNGAEGLELALTDDGVTVLAGTIDGQAVTRDFNRDLMPLTGLRTFGDSEQGAHSDVQLAALTDGDIMAAWETRDGADEPNQIVTATFAPSADAAVQIGNHLPDTLTGTDGPDVLWGMAGMDDLQGLGDDDRLNGGTNHDRLEGGMGNDTLLGEGGDDTMIGGPGSDMIDGGYGWDIASYDGAERRVFLDLQYPERSFNDAGGDSLVNIDVIEGSRWSDQLRGDALGNTLHGAAGWDRLYGRAGDDTLSGGGGGDVLYGNNGVDTMTGGPGTVIDRFVFFHASDSGVGAGNRDIITDFGLGGDRIELSRIDADITQGFRQDFRFIGDAAFSGSAGELRYEAGGGITLVQADRDGDGTADFEIELAGEMALVFSDFLF